MRNTCTATAERNGGADSGAAVAPELLTVKDMAALLRASPRHVRRLADMGALPRPVSLGRSIRWRAEEIRTWLRAGCPRKAVSA